MSDNNTIKTAGSFVESSLRVYGEYVNLSRAIPSALDGLKPVQRRIVYAMAESGFKPGRAGGTVKSARVVGDTMGKYHPHGNAAIYETLVGMAHDRYPLVRGEGNFGTAVCGQVIDPPAADRYTETLLTPLGAAMCQGLDATDFIPNHDGSGQEPSSLPVRLPLLLMNGSEGIGLGISTAIPPHNLRELGAAATWLLSLDSRSGTGRLAGSDRLRMTDAMRPDVLAKAIAKRLKGPDYGSGVLLSDPGVVSRLYERGHGTLKFRCKYHFETVARGKDEYQMLVVTEYAPRFNPRTFEETCSKLASDGLILWAADQSTSKGTKKVDRLCVAFKDAGPITDLVIPMLTTSVSYNFNTVLTTVDRSVADADPTLSIQPHCTVVTLLLFFLDHRRAIELRMAEREAAAAKKKLDQVLATIKAVENLERLTKILTMDLSEDALTDRIAKDLDLTKEQATYLLDQPVRKLARMSVPDLKAQHEKHSADLQAAEADLADIDSRVGRILKADIDRFGDDRGTDLSDSVSEAVEFAASSPVKVVGLSFSSGTPKAEKFGPEYVKDRKKVKHERIIDAHDFFSLVYEDGHVRRVKLSFMSNGNQATWLRSSPIIAAISDRDKVIVAAEQSGKVAVVRHEGTVDEYALAKGGKIVSVTGMREQDKLLVFGTTGAKNPSPKGRTRDFRWVFAKAKRRGSMPRALLPQATVVRLVRAAPNVNADTFMHTLVGDGSHRPIVAKSTPRRVAQQMIASGSDVIHAVWDQNLVVLANGRKRVYSGKRVIKMIRRGEAPRLVLPWSAWSAVAESVSE